MLTEAGRQEPTIGSNDLQPNSNGLHPSGDGLLLINDGLKSTSSKALTPRAMASNLQIAMTFNLR